MDITTVSTRPYRKDPSRLHVDIHFTDPRTNQPDRKIWVAPAKLSESKASVWAVSKLHELYGFNQTTAKAIQPEPVREESIPIPQAPKHEVTLERFFRDDFMVNYVSLQRAATQTAYDSLWRNHLSTLAHFPMSAIDEQTIDTFIAERKNKGLEGSTVNLLLSKLAKIFRWALKHKKIDRVPTIDKIKVERRERPHYTIEQIAQIRSVFGRLSPEDAVVFLLAFEAGMRTGEIAALRWEDIDIAHNVIKIRRTIYRNTEGPPKGTVGDVGLTRNLLDAIKRLKRRGHRVLYRCSHHTGGQHAQHTEHSVKSALNRMQRMAGLDLTGLHILRHSGITFLADQGADVHTLKVFARHSRTQTTDVYLHQSKHRLAQSAASMFDGNAVATRGNKTKKRGSKAH